MNRFNKELKNTIGELSDVSIDSLKIRIPISEVEILNPEISQRWGEVSEDGEIGTLDFKAKRFVHRMRGATTSYLIQKRKSTALLSEDFLIILLNSKILESHYFQGITKSNIKHVYALLMIQGHVSFTFDAFMHSAVTDCDIKRDFPTCGTAHQEQIVKGFRDLTRLSKVKSKGYTMNCGQNAIIIQWSKRDIATPSSPHVKFYSKDLELAKKSYVFAESNGLPTESILRLEGTIKNRDHFRYLLKQKDTTFNLCDILALNQSNLVGMLTGMLHKHIEAPTGTETNKGRAINISEAFALALIQVSKKSKAELIIFMQRYTTDKHQQARAKKIIHKVWPSELDTDKNLQTDGVYKFVFGK